MVVQFLLFQKVMMINTKIPPFKHSYAYWQWRNKDSFLDNDAIHGATGYSMSAVTSL